MIQYEEVRLFQVEDLYTLPICLFLIMYVAFVRYEKRYKNSQIGVYFFPALIIRLLSCLVNGLIIEYYYNGIGDYKGYFMMLLNITHRVKYEDVYIQDVINFENPTDSVAQIAFLLSLLWGKSAQSISMCFVLFNFIGSWRLFKVFFYMYPHLHKQIALIVLFLPSIFFWSSGGMMKEPLCFGGLGFLLFASYNAFIVHKKKIYNIVIIILSSWLIFLIKPYIIISFFPALLIWLLTEFSKIFKNFYLRVGINMVCLFILLILIYVTGQVLSEMANSPVSRYTDQQKIVEEIVKQHDYYESEGNSYFSLGTFEPSIQGIINMFPSAIIAVLFRPYIFEVQNPLMLFSALESCAFLGVTGFVLLRLGPFKLLREIGKSPFMLFCCIFTFIFAGFVGVSTFNFGTLVRYKIPCLPFYGMTLLLLLEKCKKNRLSKISS